MSVGAAAHDRAKYRLTIKRNERSPSREIAAHNQRNVHAVGSPETIGMRTALYFIMIALSLTAMIGGNSFKRLCIPRLGEWNANLMMAAFYIVIVTLAGLLLPAVNEVPDGFPAIVLWEFRMASFGAQLIMWATLGLLFGALTQRAPAVGKPSM
jgi:Probable cobalt transporter subunit (CbtA)